ncbi:uncharacterized protein LOC6535744 [Drosophila yakuba]|uniref:Uncharacterized protein, isoform A n=1 Tax=Drosophila yakuba TaxID=7245 RepID=B4PNL7_DROYA|nr:uncharacterized protein LOC6535744 [Drosophila yakuba]EDW96080.1 uncharacterized protein Dyak_GE25102, isoform A [Drosophila yakuba]
MKPKKSAFANSSTGYGRNKHGKGHSGKDKAEGGGKGKNREEKVKHKHDQRQKQEVDEKDDKDLNSGFGDYLRTPEAFEMMKLFVFANTIMLIVTMAWPHIKEQFYMVNQWLESFREEHQQ